jgi:hypothetical protein
MDYITPSRPPIGRLNGVTGEIGTILGPDDTGQWFSIIGTDAEGVLLGFATADEMDALQERTDVYSPTEYRTRYAMPARKGLTKTDAVALIVNRFTSARVR